MPECPSKYRLVRFDSGLLSPEERTSIELHLKTCESCRETLSGMREVFSEFDGRVDDHLARLRYRISQQQTNNVVHLKRRQPKRALLAVMTVALATAAAVVFVLFPIKTQFEPLPSYELESTFGEQNLRGPEVDSKTIQLKFGTYVELIARPTASLEGRFEADAFALTPNAAYSLGQFLRKDDSGAVRLAGIVGSDLSLPRETTSLGIVVARPGNLPNASEVLKLFRTANQEKRPDLVVLLERKVRLVDK